MMEVQIDIFGNETPVEDAYNIWNRSHGTI